MRIGELARSAGVTVKALRYYESLGLLSPARLPNGYRDYDAHAVRVAREIASLSRLGIPVEATRPFVDCLAAGERHADDCPASLAGYQRAIDDLTARIASLTARRATLVAHLRAAAHRSRTDTTTAPPPPRGGEGHPMDDDLTRLPAGLPVPEDDGAADHLPGTPLPHLELPDTSGGLVALDRLGPGRTVLYIYPLTGRPDRDLPTGWDTIPGARGCTPEACGFRDHHADLLAAGANRVHGLSSQPSPYQREVVDRLHLPFTVLSDPALTLAAVLKLPTFEADGRVFYRRLTLIARDAAVEHVFYPVFPPDQHAAQVLDWLRAHPL
ncbi:MerR family DNA-binding transcriptional regulator [Streptomyces albus subsp. chlorinus]|uniref:MerR family DNA-binding transcriptional regulator n=1 Tax=Streptomyces albus TaxID=1888 RepID=UPI00156F93F6|nr:MerR family DNA-binding transcriptional regulator [Streptomyces albus]NSC25028.1 MerR family DNA-binding transcriptional regulator [Streptomyces albus subsp. chlorinus]